MKKPAFTLIEVIVVVGIVLLVTTFSLTSYFVFNDRQKVENAAKEAIIYLRRIQNNARTGNRGEGHCNPPNVTAAAADGTNRLRAWTTTIYHSSKTDSTPATLTSVARCLISGNADSSFDNKEVFTFPKGVYITRDGDSNDTLYFDSLFGSLTVGSSDKLLDVLTDTNNHGFTMGTSDSSNNATFIITDGTYSYRFHISEGAITSGCSCKKGPDCKGSGEEKC